MKTLISAWNTSDKLLVVPVFISWLTALVLLGTFVFLDRILPDKVPLFYSLPWGQAQLVSKQQLFILPLILILISLVNALLAFQLHEVQRALKRMLTLSLILINLIIIITALKILLIFI